MMTRLDVLLFISPLPSLSAKGSGSESSSPSLSVKNSKTSLESGSSSGGRTEMDGT